MFGITRKEYKILVDILVRHTNSIRELTERIEALEKTNPPKTPSESVLGFEFQEQPPFKKLYFKMKHNYEGMSKAYKQLQVSHQTQKDTILDLRQDRDSWIGGYKIMRNERGLWKSKYEKVVNPPI